MSRIAYVNGAYVPLESASISILDRGFLFADGIYEVSAVIAGRLIDNESHMTRLVRSLGEIRLALPLPLDEIEAVQKELITRNALDEGVVYLQITRGAAEREFGFPADAKPSLVLFTQAKKVTDPAAAHTGVAVKTVPDLRWARRDIKSVALLAQVLAKQAAIEAGCQEAWMIDGDGLVTEGSSSTAFIITTDGVVVTRANSNAILPGCTRKALLALAAERQVRIEERSFTAEEAKQAAEAFMTSASSFVMPIVRIDDTPVGSGKPGALTLRLRELYLDFARKA